MTTLVLDNGAYMAKYGISGGDVKVVPNCLTKARNIKTRIFIGDQIEDCKDLSGLYYLLPFQKGYLVHGDRQKDIWDHMFSKNCLKIDNSLSEMSALVTEPYCNFQSIGKFVNELFFEAYQFKSIYKCNPSFLSQFKYSRENKHKNLCCLVVDSGYSFTHIIPYRNGKKVVEGMKRIDVGRKMLTNHLKDIISYRQLMVMDETFVINQCKEDVCYVSTQFMKDMDIARKRGKDNTVARDYVLPDYTHIKRGHVRSAEESTGRPTGDEQIIRMNNERFTVPELLFNPQDVKIHEMGIPEAIKHSIDCLPEELQPHMYSNILLTGGNCMLPGFKERVETDVRSWAPDEFDVCVHLASNPVTDAWQGGNMLSKENQFSAMTVTKEEYDEHGHNICIETFDI